MRHPASPSDLGFTTYDRKRLQQALATASEVRTFRRIQAVLLVACGSSFADAASITGLSARAAYHVVGEYLRTHLVSALHERARSGRPPAAPEVTDERILRELAKVPRSLGFRTNVWTVDLLAAHLSARYKCSISPRTLRRRMRAIGLRCKRPRYVYSEKEAHVAQKKGRSSGG